MSGLLEFNVELLAVRDQLKRIADALERAFPVPEIPQPRARKVDARDLSVVTNEKLYDLEQEEGTG